MAQKAKNLLCIVGDQCSTLVGRPHSGMQPFVFYIENHTEDPMELQSLKPKSHITGYFKRERIAF